MNADIWVGYLLFILVPLVLWIIGISSNGRKGWLPRWFAFVAGSDNRLSLSRLQAFVWTLVIFGSFVAATAVHESIMSGRSEDKVAAQTKAKSAAEREATLIAVYDKAVIEDDTASQQLIVANQNFAAAEPAFKSKSENPLATADEKEAARKAFVTAQDALAVKTNSKKIAEDVLTAANKDKEEAKKFANVAAADARKYNWIEIPIELLALAGIALGSGVFSSLISAVNSEDKTACVTGLRWDNKTGLAKIYPKAANLSKDNYLVIEGVDMGKTGKVRLGAKNRFFGVKIMPIINWSDDGTSIIVDVLDGNLYDTLVVDTPNGKLCYDVEIQNNPTLGQAAVPAAATATAAIPAVGGTTALKDSKFYYEFVDLFRDDKSPSNFDLMKFQMFGWTFVAVFIYAWLFLADLRNDIQSLPLVPASIVILTGLSQAGYLGSKGISNVQGSGK